MRDKVSSNGAKKNIAEREQDIQSGFVALQQATSNIIEKKGTVADNRDRFFKDLFKCQNAITAYTKEVNAVIHAEKNQSEKENWSEEKKSELKSKITVIEDNMNNKTMTLKNELSEILQVVMEVIDRTDTKEEVENSKNTIKGKFSIIKEIFNEIKNTIKGIFSTKNVTNEIVNTHEKPVDKNHSSPHDNKQQDNAEQKTTHSETNLKEQKVNVPKGQGNVWSEAKQIAADMKESFQELNNDQKGNSTQVDSKTSPQLDNNSQQSHVEKLQQQGSTPSQGIKGR